jgi:DNA-binding transcriptional regulator YiaG
MPSIDTVFRAQVQRLFSRRYLPTLRRLRRRISELRSELRQMKVKLRRTAARRPVGRPVSGTAAKLTPPTGAEIRAFREKQQWPRRVLAQRLGVSSSIVFLWESGRRSPRQHRIVARLHKLMGKPGRPAAAPKRGRPKATRSTRATRATKPAPAPSGINRASIRALRARLGLSRRAFAEKVGVSPNMVYFWEIGRSLPRKADSLRSLAKLMGRAR